MQQAHDAGTAAEAGVCLLASGEAAGLDRLREGLAGEGLQLRASECAGDAQALLLCHQGPVSLALPRLRQLRSDWPLTLLLLRCPAPRELDQVLALEMGADAVVAAEAGPATLAATLRALWRLQARAGALARPAARGGEPVRKLQFGRLLIDRDRRRATLAGREVALTEGEFEVLWLLATHSGEPLSRREMLARLRGSDAAGAAAGRSIDSRVYRLRGKLGAAAPGGIRTLRHRGYLFTPSAW